MKFTKMSLVAALLVGSSAFALDNTKISGNANVYYDTQDNGANDLLRKDSSAADASLNLNVTTDLAKNSLVSVSAGAGYTVLSTLGLENNMVGNVWGSAHTATAGTGSNYAKTLGGAKVENADWINEAWIAATAGKTTVKVGRMELDTPLAFTEKWSIEKNTFEAAVAINQDLPDTTVVGAYVGNGNGTEGFGQTGLGSNVSTLGLAVGGVVNANGNFGTYGTDGAYAAGIINNSIKPVVLQAWYYDVSKLVNAYWLQADAKMDNLMGGVQYVAATVDDDVYGTSSKGQTNSAYALMVGYKYKDLATIKAAYSATDKKGYLANVGFNTATAMASAQSKLYTETWWSYGYVTLKDTKSYTFSVESPVNGMFDLGVYYTKADQANTVDGATADKDLTEYTITAGKSFGPIDATIAYINTDKKTVSDSTDDESTNRVQAYLTLNF